MTSKLHNCLLGNKNTSLWLFIGYYLLYNYTCVIFGFLFGYLLVSVCILYFYGFFINVYKRFKISQICLFFLLSNVNFFLIMKTKWIDVQNRKRGNHSDFDK